MTKQYEAKVALVNGQDTSSCRAVGACISAAYAPNMHDLTGLAIIETPMAKNVGRGNIGLTVMDLMGAFDRTDKAPTLSLWPGFSVISLVTGHAPATDDGRLI